MNRLVPAYALYGESAGHRFPDPLHIETIVARSAIHDWTIRPHRHADLWQIFVLAAGGGTADLDGSTWTLQPPLAILVPPLCVHGFAFEPGTQGHVVSIPADTLARTIGPDRLGAARRATDRAAAPQLLALGPADLNRLDRLLVLAAEDFAVAARGRAEALSALAVLLALDMERLAAAREASPGHSGRPVPAAAAQALQPRPAQARLVEAFLAQIEDDFRTQPPLSDRARRLRVGVPVLSRACRSVLGRSAQAIVHDRLLLEARRHLVYSSMSVQEVAYDLGFSDPAYFTRFFTDRVGQTPTQYRRHVASDDDTRSSQP